MKHKFDDLTVVILSHCRDCREAVSFSDRITYRDTKVYVEDKDIENFLGYRIAKIYKKIMEDRCLG